MSGFRIEDLRKKKNVPEQCLLCSIIILRWPHTVMLFGNLIIIYVKKTRWMLWRKRKIRLKMYNIMSRFRFVLEALTLFPLIYYYYFFLYLPLLKKHVHIYLCVYILLYMYVGAFSTRLFGRYRPKTNLSEIL